MDEYDGIGDGVLLGKFLDSGDEYAFGILSQRHRPMVLRVCRRVCGNEQDAEDAAQITFTTLAERGDRVRTRRSLAGWLHWTAWHIAMRLRRAHESRRRAERRAGVANVASATAAAAAAIRSGLDGDEEQQRLLAVEVDRALALLPDEYREVLILHHVEGLTVQEAAKRTGWAVGTVASRLSRGRGELRSRLQQRGVTLTLGALVLIIEGEVSSAFTLTAAAGATAVAAAAVESWTRSKAPAAAVMHGAQRRGGGIAARHYAPTYGPEHWAHGGGAGGGGGSPVPAVMAPGKGVPGMALSGAAGSWKFSTALWLMGGLCAGAGVAGAPAISSFVASINPSASTSHEPPETFHSFIGVYQPPASVPEPGTLSAAALTGGWMLLRRRRRIRPN
jgi:RNA polymerase sigma factor (sigma-70 family)